jgi:hypothetical protein
MDNKPVVHGCVKITRCPPRWAKGAKMRWTARTGMRLVAHHGVKRLTHLGTGCTG